MLALCTRILAASVLLGSAFAKVAALLAGWRGDEVGAMAELGLGYRAMAVASIAIESIAAVLLMTPRWRVGARVVAYFVVAAAVYGAGLALEHGDSARCGCFGRTESPPLERTIVLAALLGSVVGLLRSDASRSFATPR